MTIPFRWFFLFIALSVQLLSAPIETFYGTLEVDEPVILELIASPSFQRLRSVRQYGVAYYVSHREKYTRYDHSLGVFAILRLKGAPLEEQLAGLLHDVSHTVFSHVGDWVFGVAHTEEDYQNSIHTWYLKEAGLNSILNKHGFSSQQVDPKNSQYRMLEQPLPNLCADRIDYNIQGAYFQNIITREEGISFLKDLNFVNGEWVSTRADLAAKVMNFSLFMTKDCWGSALNDTASHWLSEALHRAVQINLLSWNEFHFGTDDEIWERLHNSNDPFIAKRMKFLANPLDYFCLVAPEQADRIVHFKNRGIDPWILHQGQRRRLTSINPELAKYYEEVKRLALVGWPVKLLTTP